MKLSKGKVNLLIDGQFGSTGKGLLASYIGKNNNIDICVSNAGPNAGHTFYRRGRKCVVKQLPVTAITNPTSTIYLCSGAIINIGILLRELKEFNIDTQRLIIHPQAAIISEEDILSEQKGTAVYISSTQNGVGKALSRKINRESNIARNYPELSIYIKALPLNTFLNEGQTLFMEVPQGYSLSLNSKFYPCCTSRNITVSSALNDLDIHPYYLGNTIASIRTHPIRVGNLPKGYSGRFYMDSIETSWDELNLPKEYTTNTKRVRRVATFSFKQYEEMLQALRPNYVFLNFCNYINKNTLNTFLKRMPEITHLGFGPKIEDIKEV